MLSRSGCCLRLKFNPYASFMDKKGRGGLATTAASRAREDKISASRRRQEEQIILPKTLKSGRFDEKVTIAQKIADDHDKKKELEEKLDTRFSQRITDFRQIQDPDAMSQLFGETKHTQKVRVREWQRQFEKENENVWLPYERTNFLTRNFMPNWFVKMMVEARDRGGFGRGPFIGVFFFVLFVLYGFARSMYGTAEEKADISAIR